MNRWDEQVDSMDWVKARREACKRAMERAAQVPGQVSSVDNKPTVRHTVDEDDDERKT